VATIGHVLYRNAAQLGNCTANEAATAFTLRLAAIFGGALARRQCDGHVGDAWLSRFPRGLPRSRRDRLQPTAIALRFGLDQAGARDAVWAPLDFEGIAESLREQLARRSRPRHREGPRRVSASSRCRSTTVARCAIGPGRNARFRRGDHRRGRPVLRGDRRPTLDLLRPRLLARPRIGPVALGEQGRVAIGDEIGETARSANQASC
jgi:hypothetical protein